MFPLFACSDDLEWGHLSGRFVYNGDPPPVKMHLADKDKAALGDRIPDESLIVNKKNRGIENIIVYLSPKKSAGHFRQPSSTVIPTEQNIPLLRSVIHG